MAKRRRSTSAVRVVRSAPRAAAPIIKIAQPRAPSATRKRRGTRRRASRRSSIVGGVSGALHSGIADAVGGALFGFAVKQGWVAKLPAIPIVGRTGTAAIVLHYLAKRGGGEYVKRAAVAAAVIAGYQLGSTGAILGDASTPGSLGDDSYADGDEDE